MKKENIFVSACLLGENCRYDGANNKICDIEKLNEKYNLISFCPEVSGGLSTPREPAEILGDKVVTKSGKDVTRNFEIGAKKALIMAKKYNCKKALLKSKSPSCGYGAIYDGKFSKNLIENDGICAKLLSKNGIEIFNELEYDRL
ncbi:MAG: DUF523 domain-containing protein [Tissierellia bacterium]|nr:DUF523 domain-containing protein [Tissierellia bacterium]